MTTGPPLRAASPLSCEPDGADGDVGASASVGQPSGDEAIWDGLLYRVSRLASLPIEQLDHPTWATELLDACTALVPSAAGTVWLLDGQARIVLAGLGQDAGTQAPTERCGDGRRWSHCSQARGPVVVESTGSSPRQVVFPIREGAELRGVVELQLARTVRAHDYPPAVLDTTQWLVDVAARVLTNLEAYRREREAGELLQRLLDRL